MSFLIPFVIAFALFFGAVLLSVLCVILLIGKQRRIVTVRPEYERYLSQRLFESEQSRMRTEGQLREKCEEVLSLQFEKIENQRVEKMVDSAFDAPQADTIEAEEFW
jgi:hypothetical protein